MLRLCRAARGASLTYERPSPVPRLHFLRPASQVGAEAVQVAALKNPATLSQESPGDEPRACLLQDAHFNENALDILSSTYVVAANCLDGYHSAVTGHGLHFSGAVVP